MYKLLLVILSFANAQFHELNFRTKFEKGIEEFIKSREISTEFRDFLNSIPLNHGFEPNSNKKLGHRNFVSCILCLVVVETVLELNKHGMDKQHVVESFTKFCEFIYYKDVCRGVIITSADTIYYIISNKPNINANIICDTILQDEWCSSDSIPELNVTIPENTIVEFKKGQQTEAEPIKVLQLTDIHYDPNYLVGGNADCDKPLCCQLHGGLATDPSDAAGTWGDYRKCDTPKHVIDTTFNHISDQHTDIDYIFFTGDIISHRIWDTSITNNTATIVGFYESLYKAFPKTPVYPVLGNHEPHPLNGFAPTTVVDSSVSTNWLYKKVANLWTRWLPESTKETILRGGYYTVRVRPGFRIITLNSNVAYTWNWWLLYETDSISAQLQWLVNTLLDAEKNDEKVHILSHVPSGHDTYIPYSKQFRRIVDRFYNTITAIYTGHTHYDEWLLYHSTEDPSKPIATAWNGGSLTSYTNVNPNYKIYTVDGGNYEVLDFESWYYNITEANLSPGKIPVWRKMYSFKEAYGLKNLSPKEIRNLLERMTKDHDLLQTYYSHKYRSADTRDPCDESCMRDELCRMVVVEKGDKTQCEKFMDMFD